MLIVSNVSVTVIPVAIGMTTDAVTACKPDSFRASRARQLHNLLMSDDPAAFG